LPEIFRESFLKAYYIYFVRSDSVHFITTTPPPLLGLVGEVWVQRENFYLAMEVYMCSVSAAGSIEFTTAV